MVRIFNVFKDEINNVCQRTGHLRAHQMSKVLSIRKHWL